MFAFFRGSILLFVFAAATPALWGAPRPKHVFIISIDGGKPAVIAQSTMPALKRLVAEGAWTWTARTTYPSITLPSHTSMLTGVGPQKHKVLWNNWRPDAGMVMVPTVFSEAGKAGRSTAMFVGKKKFRHLAQSGTVDYFGYHRAQAREVIKQIPGSSGFEKSITVLAGTVADDAARYIREKKPNLCFIHFTDPDDEGHTYGWGSREQMSAFENVDAALGVVLKALDDAGITSESVVIITADHGGHGKTHGLNIPDDMEIPWIVWGKRVKPGFQIEEPVTTYDTAVTALWLLDVPLLDSFDGRVVDSAFDREEASKPPG